MQPISNCFFAASEQIRAAFRTSLRGAARLSRSHSDGSPLTLRTRLEAPWPPYQVALHLVATLLQQERHLSIGLDALGKHRHAKSMSKADDGPYDGQ